MLFKKGAEMMYTDYLYYDKHIVHIHKKDH